MVPLKLSLLYNYYSAVYGPSLIIIIIAIIIIIITMNMRMMVVIAMTMMLSIVLSLKGSDEGLPWRNNNGHCLFWV